MTIKVWCRVRSGVDHEVAEVDFEGCTSNPFHEFVQMTRDLGGLLYSNRFIPWHQITYIEVAECPPPTLPA